jgi:glycopeptide antibiotics resistance protein
VSGERRIAVCSVALFGYVMVLLMVVLTPSTRGPDQVLAALTDLAMAAGAPRGVTLNAVEILLNVVMTAPLTALASVVWPDPSWRDWTAWAFVTFGAVEAVQGLLLPGRHGSFSDVVANTAGCCLGALAVVVVRHAGVRRAG